MSEMVERVARALRNNKASLSNPEADALARAAIAEMREPTADMVSAGMLAEGTTLPAEYRAMIDQALVELGPLRPAGSADLHKVPRAEE
jgi:hypothetical protein